MNFAYKIEVYELWFEHLRLALSSDAADVRAALVNSKNYYDPWGDVRSVTFAQWWAEHANLFAEPDPVRVIDDSDDFPIMEGCFGDPLYIEVHLTLPPEQLGERVADLIRRATAIGFWEHKSKVRSRARYTLTQGTEAKWDRVRERLEFYRDVVLKTPHLRGKLLLDAARQHYGNNMPRALNQVHKADPQSVIRAMRRMIANAERTVLSVAGGDFPGR